MNGFIRFQDSLDLVARHVPPCFDLPKQLFWAVIYPNLAEKSYSQNRCVSCNFVEGLNDH